MTRLLHESAVLGRRSVDKVLLPTNIAIGGGGGIWQIFFPGGGAAAAAFGKYFCPVAAERGHRRRHLANLLPNLTSVTDVIH